MQIRVQLIENSPLHRVPSILLNMGKSQFIFNVIPTLVRHRKHHQINLLNSSYIFFTKNSIEAVGGLPNYLLFRSGSQKSNQYVTNNVYLYANSQMTNYLQKLRFKIGYKAMRFSFCSWTMRKYRFGISSIPLFNKVKVDPAFPKLFIKIQSYLLQRCKPQDYFDSRSNLMAGKTDHITIDTTYFHTNQINIHPIHTKADGIRFTHYICTFPDKQSSILILHYTTIESVKCLLRDQTMINYFANNNQTGLVVHIVQDKIILRTIQFGNLISNFNTNTQHLWFGHQFNNKNQQHILRDKSNIEQQKVWSELFPTIMKNIYQERMKYYDGKNINLISQLFPFLNNYSYRKIYAYITDQTKGHRYQERTNLRTKISKIELLTQIIQNNKDKIEQLQNRVGEIIQGQQFKPKVVFLGTNSSMPTVQRNTSGILACLSQQSNILLDCGEQTFEQMANHYSPDEFQHQLMKIRVIFITHIHSDHNIGILNLISQRQRLLRKNKKQSKLYLVIPFNVYNWYAEYNNSIEDLSESCDVLFTQDKDIEERPNQLQKKGNTLGVSTCNPNTLQDKYYSEIDGSAKTKDLVTSLMPSQQNRLQEFKKLLNDHKYQLFLPVRVIHCPQSFGIIIKCQQFKLSYSGDTRPSKPFGDSASNSDLMIHEATFNDEQSWKAQRYKHSTVEQAVKIGYDSGSKQLALTHFNSLFKIPTKINSKDKYRQYFEDRTILALDHLQVPLKYNQQLSAVSKLLSTLSQLANRTDQSDRNDNKN